MHKHKVREGRWRGELAYTILKSEWAAHPNFLSYKAANSASRPIVSQGFNIILQ